MAKFTLAEEDDAKIVYEVAEELGLAQIGIDFQVLLTDKAKDVCKVVKASDITEVISNRDDLVAVILYADAFDLVDEKTKYMWVRMEMEKISYDSEKDKINIGCPVITVPVDFYDKYKDEAVQSALLAQLTIAQIKDKEKQEKAEKKKAKKQK